MKTKQQLIDDKAITDHKAVGANNPGGQDKIDPQRFVPNVEDDANHLPKRFNGIRIQDEGPDTWGIKKLKPYEHK